MDPDSITIFYSYLTLEEILTYFKSNKNFRDKLINKNYKEFPDIDDEICVGNLETIKYMCEEKDFKLFDISLDFAEHYNHLEIIKYVKKYLRYG